MRTRVYCVLIAYSGAVHTSTVRSDASDADAWDVGRGDRERGEARAARIVANLQSSKKGADAYVLTL